MVKGLPDRGGGPSDSKWCPPSLEFGEQLSLLNPAEKAVRIAVSGARAAVFSLALSKFVLVVSVGAQARLLLVWPALVLHRLVYPGGEGTAQEQIVEELVERHGRSNSMQTSCRPGMKDDRYTFFELLAPWLKRMMSVPCCRKPAAKAKHLVW